MNTKWMHPMNLFSLIMIIIIIFIGIGMLITPYFKEIIWGTNRTILGWIFIVYAGIRGIRFYQLIKAKEDEELL